MDISSHCLWLENFIRQKLFRSAVDPEPLLLKQRHCRKVFAIAQTLVRAEKPARANACLLAALYHDIARFDQYLEYHTFNDSRSTDHGNLGVKILKRQNILANEESEDRQIIYTAIILHNKRSLPPGLNFPYKTPTLLVRDADKLDILRIMAEHLSGPRPYSPVIIRHLADDPDVYSEDAIEAVKNRKAPTYELAKSLNDYRLLLGSWFYEMNFASSRKLFISQGFGERLIEQLPDTRIYGVVKRQMLRDLRSQA